MWLQQQKFTSFCSKSRFLAKFQPQFLSFFCFFSVLIAIFYDKRLHINRSQPSGTRSDRNLFFLTDSILLPPIHIFRSEHPGSSRRQSHYRNRKIRIFFSGTTKIFETRSIRTEKYGTYKIRQTLSEVTRSSNSS